MKTIDDCTREDFCQLIEAAYSLLQSSMFQYWENGGEKDKDPSHIDAINEMRSALIQCGLEAPPYETFREGIEATLAMPVEDFVKTLQGKGVI